MHLQAPESSGPAGPEAVSRDAPKPLDQSRVQSMSLPFGQHIDLVDLGGPTYVTAQTLVQQVGYVLSDKLFTYSPESFDLDLSVIKWHGAAASNAYGYATGVSAMDTRAGAASIALGYIFSKDFDLQKRHIPQTLLGSSASLDYLRPALEQLSLLYAVASPFVGHIAAVEYQGASQRSLVTDYTPALNLADDLGLGLVCTPSVHEIQHMSLLSTLLANILPTLHIYDGVTVARETVRVVDVLDQQRLSKVYQTISDNIIGPGKKQSNVDTRVSRLLKSFNDELGTTYAPFEYHGHNEPENVLVVFGTVESSIASQLMMTALSDRKIGVIVVRIYRPFLEEDFISVLPTSTQKVSVLGQVANDHDVLDESIHSRLYNDVLAAVMFSGISAPSPEVTDLKYYGNYEWTVNSMSNVLKSLSDKRHGSSVALADLGTIVAAEEGVPQSLDSRKVQEYTFWDSGDSKSLNAATVVGQFLSKKSSNSISLRSGHDNFVQGGVIRTDIRSSKHSIEAPYPAVNAEVVYVADEKVVRDIDVVGGLQEEGSLVIELPGFKQEDIETRLPAGLRHALARKKGELFIVDPEACPRIQEDPSLRAVLTQLSLLRILQGAVLSQDTLEKFSAIGANSEVVKAIAETLGSSCKLFGVPEEWAQVEEDVEFPTLPTNLNVNSFVPYEAEEIEAPTLLRHSEVIAKALTFKEAYGTQSALRPDLTTQTYTIHVTENRRLTPITYDRNIFHIEFDLGTSGLKYDIGESLGIHAENDETEVCEFIKFYGLNAEAIVEVPSREDQSVLETRTVHQSLMQNIDIFGRPTKAFYEALSEFADDDKERKELSALGGPEGAAEFKRRAEVDTLTYADILLEFPSAHPSFHEIVRIVNPLKRREYSVASSQVVNPTTVALMIVVVNWVDPKGRSRFGQATRYLHRLTPGTSVVVSVKPSVMKLPPLPTQPLIMAGLGTGLAPFRAFVQYRAWQKAQGIEIGSVLLYMGSRHQREEYLYGEEWEAYQDAGVITTLGRAFSRDQPQKIYIQDRMRQTMGDIIEAYIKEKGAFYLCGPTWPVPDVTEVLQEAIVREGQVDGRKVDGKKEIERLKEELRYVLEVY